MAACLPERLPEHLERVPVGVLAIAVGVLSLLACGVLRHARRAALAAVATTLGRSAAPGAARAPDAGAAATPSAAAPAAAAPAPHHHHHHHPHLHRRLAREALWRPARWDVTRRLLYFASGRRVPADLLAPVANALVAALLCATAAHAVVPCAWSARVAAAVRGVADEPFVGVLLLAGGLLLQDWMRNAVAGLELTTTHKRFDVGDRVTFHQGFGIPEGLVRAVSLNEVVLQRGDNGELVFVPAALAVTLAVTVHHEPPPPHDERKRAHAALDARGGGGGGGGALGNAAVPLPLLQLPAPQQPPVLQPRRRRAASKAA